jgi:RNA-directed DNA polymerase
MSAWSFLIPLWRVLKGRNRRGGALAVETDWADWANVLVQVGLPPGALRDVVEAGSLHPHFHYRHYTKPKKDSTRRQIAEPDAPLKRVQHEIIARYFQAERPHTAATAYQKGKSTTDHVWAHAGAEVIVTADLQDFFPTTRADRVEEWWRGRVDDDMARLLTLLTTLHGGLPQGAPTSPGLSNFVNRDLDERLARRAEAAGSRYTRYCDDLAFSWPNGRPPADFQNGVRATLHEFGYALHPDKGWCVYRRGDEPEITGVILTRRGRVRLPEHIHEVMQSLRRSADARDAQRLQGYLAYAAMVARRPVGRRARKKNNEPTSH